MKKLIKRVLYENVIGFLVATGVSVIMYWCTESWELAVLTWIVLIASSLNNAIGSFYVFSSQSRIPERHARKKGITKGAP